MLEAHFETQVMNYRLFKPRDYDLLYVLSEFEVEGMSRPERNEAAGDLGAKDSYGLPATVKFMNVAGVSLSSDGKIYDLPTAKLLRERFRKQRPEWSADQIEKALRGYLLDGVAFTDNTNVPPSKMGLAWAQIVTVNNVLYPTGNQKIVGELYFEVLQLQAGTYDQMMAQLEQYPFLETWATISTRGYGGREVIQFWHLGGVSVPALLFCKQRTNWIRASRVRKLTREEPIPHLYYP